VNLAQLLAQTAAKYADKPAIIFEDKVWTYRDFYDQVQHYASILDRLNIKKGDRIAVQLPKSIEFLFLHFAILSIGAIALPLNPDYRYAKLQAAIAHLSELQILFPEDLLAFPQIEFLPEYAARDNDVAMICYTSGTTGRSKGAAISHKNLFTNIKDLHQAWQWSDRDVLLHVLPLFHVHGLNVATLGCLYAGATMIMFEKFVPSRVWETITDAKCTVFMAVPTIYQRLINEWEKLEFKPDLSSMRLFISGSAPLSDQQFYQFENLTGFRILERYGMTETGMNVSNHIDPEHRKAKSVGFPLASVEIRIVDRNGDDVQKSEVGEVWIRGENVFQGYWGMPEKTAEAFVDGWFRTGDLGFQDPDDNDRLYLVGRAKELIITGGFNVYPKEIENVLESHEFVKESAVIGLPDQDFGEKVVAAIALKSEINITPEVLIKHCKTRLASYKCPKQIFFVEQLPRNAMGKLQKNILVEQFINYS
jgi:malonyl-CoA/methylmalonyl-CoA synthetase